MPTRSSHARFAVISICLVVLALTAGCSDGRPDRAPVSGQVLIDGKPLTHGFIRLFPQNARVATAEIGPDGRFTLDTFGGGDGAVLGTHPVAVAAAEQLSAVKQKWHAPKKYATPETSGLTVTINGPEDDLKIRLSWEGGRPFVEDIR